MEILLIRHGETEHNVAGLLAGVTDSRLTNHGVLQAQRLGSYLITQRSRRFSHIFTSDLQRAFMTAEEIRKAQAQPHPDQWPERIVSPAVISTRVLREKDFGSHELVPWSSKQAQNALAPESTSQENSEFRPQEEHQAMERRAERFLTHFLFPLLKTEESREILRQPESIAIVSHGIFLSVLWRALLSKFYPENVMLGHQVKTAAYGRPLARLPSWSNTGFLQLMISYPAEHNENTMGPIDTSGPMPLFPDRLLSILAVDSKEHLVNLKRTRGGLGSAPFDARQKSLEGFFKRSKQEDDPTAIASPLRDSQLTSGSGHLAGDEC